MEKEFVIKNWPIASNRGYVQLVNPEVLKSAENLDSCPVKVVSYRDENPSSLGAIKELTVKRLDDYIEEERPHTLRYAIPSGIISILPVLGIVGGAATGGTNGLNLAGVSSGLECANISSFVGSWMAKNDYCKKLIKGKTVFEKTPAEQFKTEKNEQLADIAEAIEKNTLPKMIAPTVENDCQGVDELLDKLDKSITPHTKTIYEQMRAAYKGLLVSPL